ncbi:hypothetical protein CF336_g6171 [Tilletia laevis]|nr:hypothetical protein CF336_g6171 [Tilletia laevis]
MSSPSLPLSSSSGPPPRRRNSDPTSVPSAESTAQYGITRLLTEKPAVAQLAMKLMRQGFSAPDALRAAHILDEGSKDTPACAPTGSAPPPPSTPAAIPARQRAGSVPASPSPEKSKRRRQVYDSDEDTPRARQRLRAHSPLESDALPFKINPEATNTADINELWPAASAVRKVKRYEYVDLWFFTAEGCKEAQKSRDDGREDAMVVMADGSLKRANTASGSRLDWHLTTHEFSSAVTTWVRVAKRLNLDSGIIASMKSLNEQILEHPDWATSPHDLMEWHSHQRKAWPNLRADGKRFPLDKLELVHYFKIQMRTSLNASSTALRQSQARAHGPPAAAPATLPPPQPTPRFQPPSRPPTQPRVPIQSAPTQGSARRKSAATGQQCWSKRTLGPRQEQASASGTPRNQSARPTTPEPAGRHAEPPIAAQVAEDLGTVISTARARPEIELRSLGPTPLLADGWEDALRTTHLTSTYPTIVDGIRHGFRVGMPTIEHTFAPPNHGSAEKDPATVEEKIGKEVAAGRYVGPLTRDECTPLVGGPFQSSPIALVPKADPQSPTVGTLAAAPSAAGPDDWAYTLADVDQVCSPLGVPWSPEKEQGFSGTVTFAGIQFDIAAREMSLSPTRTSAYLSDCQAWLGRSRHTKSQAERLLGRLQFACCVVPCGRPYLTGLIDFVALHSRSGQHRNSDLVARFPNARVRKDVRWWAEELGQPRVARLFHNDLSLANPGLYTDACDFGAGVVLGELEAAYVFTRGWRAEGRDIMWAEAVGAELGLLHLIAAGFHDQRVVLYIDNTSVEGGLRRGRIRNEAANLCIERFLHAGARHNLELVPLRVVTDENPADGPSRGAASVFGPLPSIPLPAALAAHVRRQAQPRPHAGSSTGATANRRRFPRPPPSSPLLITPLPAAAGLSAARLDAPLLFAGLEDARLAWLFESAFAPKTLEGYGCGVNRFVSWCVARGVPERERRPASEDLLCRFIASLAGTVTGQYIGKIISAIGAWHKMHGAPWTFQPGSRLSLVLRGAVNVTPASLRRPRRAPYTPEHLRALFAHLDLNEPKDAAVWACALTAFWALARIGEVTTPTQKDFNTAVHVTRAGFVDGGEGPGALSLPWTKTTRSAGATISLHRHAHDLCPVAAVRAHFLVNPAPSHAALFAYRQRGRIVPLSRSVLLTRLSVAAKAAGVPVLHGHSFRIGGCTELLLRGTAIEDVKAHGRWRSDAWTTYVRNHRLVFGARLAPLPEIRSALGA